MFKITLLILLVTKIGFASMESIDSECRIQAKETAINTYQSCVKDNRSQKIEEIRKEYQSKLQDLKSYYDTELKKMSTTPKSGDPSSAVPVEQTATITLKKKPKGSSSGMKMNSLPAKKLAGKSVPVRNIEQENRGEASMAVEGSDAAEIVNIDDGSI